MLFSAIGGGGYTAELHVLRPSAIQARAEYRPRREFPKRLVARFLFTQIQRSSIWEGQSEKTSFQLTISSLGALEGHPRKIINGQDILEGDYRYG